MRSQDAGEVVELTRQLGYERSAEDIVLWLEGFEASGWKDRRALVACRGDEVVGWIDASLERHLQSDPFVLIGGLVVKDGLRGLGIGQRLCATVEHWAVELGVGMVRLTSRSTREAAHRFYLREGYSQVKTSLVFEKRQEIGSRK